MLFFSKHYKYKPYKKKKKNSPPPNSIQISHQILHELHGGIMKCALLSSTGSKVTGKETFSQYAFDKEQDT